jgi:hypothetical protein
VFTPSHHPSVSERGWYDIGPGEVAALEEEGLGARFRQRIGGTIDDVQLSRVALPLAETSKRIEGGSCLSSSNGTTTIPAFASNSSKRSMASDPSRAKRTTLGERPWSPERSPLKSTNCLHPALPPDNAVHPVHSQWQR